MAHTCTMLRMGDSKVSSQIPALPDGQHYQEIYPILCLIASAPVLCSCVLKNTLTARRRQCKEQVIVCRNRLVGCVRAMHSLLGAVTSAVHVSVAMAAQKQTHFHACSLV
eukprot:scpid109928/ scgid16924/ 